MMEKERHIWLKEGKWQRVAKYYVDVCCKCNLKHQVETKVTSKGRIYHRWWIIK